MTDKIGGYTGSGNREDAGPPPTTGSATAPKEPTNYLKFTDPEIFAIRSALYTQDDEGLTNRRGSTDVAWGSALEKVERHIADFALDR